MSQIILFLGFLALASQARPCEINWECHKCISNNCVFLISKFNTCYCVADYKGAVDMRMIVQTDRSCRVALKLVKKLGITNGATLDEISKPSSFSDFVQQTNLVTEKYSPTTTSANPTIFKKIDEEISTTSTTTEMFLQPNTTKRPVVTASTTTKKAVFYTPSMNSTQRENTFLSLHRNHKKTSSPTTSAPSQGTTLLPIDDHHRQPPVERKSVTFKPHAATNIQTSTHRVALSTRPHTHLSVNRTQPPETTRKSVMIDKVIEKPAPNSPTSTTPSPHYISPHVPPTKPADTKPISQSSIAKCEEEVVEDHPELFLTVPTKFECNNGIRNESIILAYVMGLCTLDRIITRIGYTRFDQTDMGYLLLNRARRFTGFCHALRRYKKKCKKSQPIRRIRDFNPSIKSGTFSPMFASVNGFTFCLEKSEPKFDRVGRHLCYLADMYASLKKATKLNNFDDGYIKLNPAFAYQSKCRALTFRKAVCYK